MPKPLSGAAGFSLPVSCSALVLTLALLAGTACAPVSADKNAPPPAAGAIPDSPLRDTYWKLMQLRGAPVQVADNQREPHLVFAGGERHSVSGSGGCNRVMGGFQLEGDTLRLGQLAGTMMACPAGMEQEQRFLAALAQVQRYRIEGDVLELLDGAGAVVARFEAVALR